MKNGSWAETGTEHSNPEPIVIGKGLCELCMGGLVVSPIDVSM
jgi:hypothetical protein